MEGLTPIDSGAIWAVLAVALLAILYAFVLYRQVIGRSQGNESMQALAQLVAVGARAYRSPQIRTLAVLTVILAILLAVGALLIEPPGAAVERFGAHAALWLAVGQAGALLVGALFAAVAGLVGLQVAQAGGIRTAAAAIPRDTGYSQALLVSYRAGSVNGILSMALVLLGSTVLVLLFGPAVPGPLLGFAFGGALAALVLRVGGGIYIGAAGEGAAIATRAEVVPPADTPQNPTTVARLVGDAAGDGAGATSDIFESLAVTLAAALVTGLLLADAVRGTVGDGLYAMRFLIFPLLLGGIGLLASIIGNALVRTNDRQRNARAAINRGFYVALGLIAVAFTATNVFYMINEQTGAIEWLSFCSAFNGIVIVLVLQKLTEYFTATRYNAVKAVSRADQNGSTAGMLSGMSLGLEASVSLLLILAGSVLLSVSIHRSVPPDTQLLEILYGFAMTGIGVLSVAGCSVAMSSFGAVADSAQRIGQAAELEKNPRNVLEDLSAVGGTLKTATRGTAVGAAALAGIALFGALLVSAIQMQAQSSPTVRIDLFDLGDPFVLAGFLLGGVVPLLWTAFLLRSVLRAAAQMVNTLRQQSDSEPEPSAAQVVGRTTAATQGDIVGLGIVGVLLPVLVGLMLGVGALGGFLGGAILSGVLLAVMYATMGGALDNARKYIEDGFYGGRNSAAHQAAVIGAGLGGPLRDAAGPALGSLVKLASLTALLIVPVIVVVHPPGTLPTVGALGASVVCLIALVAAVWQSRREVVVETKTATRTVSTKTRA